MTPIRIFGSQFVTFIFVDIRYQFAKFDMPPPAGWKEVTESIVVEGQPVDMMRSVAEGKHRYRELSPAWRRSKYLHKETGRQIDIVFRRGFGQYALHELRDGSLGMFFHRGDSIGECGSGVIYLGNRRMYHPPISMQMEIIKRKLSNPGLIVSDGSNTTIHQLIAASQGHESITSFESHGLEWKRVNVLPPRLRDARRSVVWRVTPQSNQKKIEN